MCTARRTLCIIAALACLGLLFGAVGAWAGHGPDLNNDGVVNILDISFVGSCFGQNPATSPECALADLNHDGNIAIGDVNAAVTSFIQNSFPTGAENTPPVADAGPDQTGFGSATITLNGSGSSDLDGDSLTFSWTLTSVPADSVATLSDPTAVMPTFVIDAFGTYEANLIVSDGTDDSVPDTVMITTLNSAPVADAGMFLRGGPI